ncbi:MAG TPA: NADH-quinone oxidoreductase subunit N [Verrucomicrobiae bacterium]|nr:NADH-quinone oxidoreductase subunit N [Verrucomicrobiae bacterium]
MSEFYNSMDHNSILPAMMLVLFGCAILLFDFWVFPDPRHRKYLLIFVVLGEIFTGYSLYQQSIQLQSGPLTGFHGAVTVDGSALFFNWIFVIAAMLVAIVSYKYLENAGEHHGEYYSLILFAQCGMYFLATGTDLVTLFIGLELMALCFYVMVGFLRSDKRSNEAAIKYLLLGAFSTGFLVYGFSILYGLADSTNLMSIVAAISAKPAWDPVVFLALATTAVGLLFKISAAPFHMWAPDAYEGAPTTVTAYLSVASKAASIAFLLRLFYGPLAPFASTRQVWEPLMSVIAVLTLTLGNLAAINQTNIKRLLAYSSISHAGYMLLGLIAGNDTGINGIMVYVMVYTFMNLGAFLVIVAMRRQGIIGEDLEDLSGLMRKSPGYAVLMLIFMLSLAGIPPTAGFLGKYYIFLALIQTHHYTLAVIATLYVAVAIYYYFKIVRTMFVGEVTEKAPLATSFGMRVALGVTGLMTLAIGIYPQPFLQLALPMVSR